MGSNGLTSLPYILAFGLSVYWMMKRGGCGMHAHGGDGGAWHRHDAPENPDAKHAEVSGATTDPALGCAVSAIDGTPLPTRAGG